MRAVGADRMLINAMDDGDCTPQYCSVHVRNKQLIGLRVAQVLLRALCRKLYTYFCPHKFTDCVQSPIFNPPPP